MRTDLILQRSGSLETYLNSHICTGRPEFDIIVSSTNAYTTLPSRIYLYVNNINCSFPEARLPHRFAGSAQAQTNYLLIVLSTFIIFLNKYAFATKKNPANLTMDQFAISRHTMYKEGIHSILVIIFPPGEGIIREQCDEINRRMPCKSIYFNYISISPCNPFVTLKAGGPGIAVAGQLIILACLPFSPIGSRPFH